MNAFSVLCLSIYVQCGTINECRSVLVCRKIMYVVSVLLYLLISRISCIPLLRFNRDFCLILEGLGNFGLFPIQSLNAFSVCVCPFMSNVDP